MAISKKQDGMSTIGWILLIGFIIAVSIPGMKIIPIYINDLKIHNALNKMKSATAVQTNLTNPSKIKKDLLDRFELQQMPEITPDEIIVTQSQDKFTIRITHQYKEHLFKDRYFTLNIDKTVEIPIIIKN